MDTSLLDTLSLVLGAIIGFVGYMIFNVIFNAAEFLKYEVYKKEKEFKQKNNSKTEKEVKK